MSQGAAARNPLPRALRPFWDGNILIADGAMGTMLQQGGLPPGGCPEVWNLQRPDVVRRIHEAYIDAGARLIESNTFGATRLKMEAYELGDRVAEHTRAGVELALAAAAGRAAVAVSIGPLGHLVEPLGEISFARAQELFYEQTQAAAAAGAELAIIETMLDLQETRAAIFACREAGLDTIVQLTFNQDGRAFSGTEPEAAVVVLEALGAGVIGANCSLGPEGLRAVVERMARVASVPVSVQANAGLPRLEDDRTIFPMDAPDYASWGPRLVEAGASIVGGCCGTTPGHIAGLARALAGCRLPGLSRRDERLPALALASRMKALFFFESNLPVVIGERINPTGRRRLSRDIQSGAMQLVRQEARDQVAAGRPCWTSIAACPPSTRPRPWPGPSPWCRTPSTCRWSSTPQGRTCWRRACAPLPARRWSTPSPGSRSVSSVCCRLPRATGRLCWDSRWTRRACPRPRATGCASPAIWSRRRRRSASPARTWSSTACA